jgi:hypothetical protein
VLGLTSLSTGNAGARRCVVDAVLVLQRVCCVAFQSIVTHLLSVVTSLACSGVVTRLAYTVLLSSIHRATAGLSACPSRVGSEWVVPKRLHILI